MAAPSLPVSAAALRRADLLYKKGDQPTAPREAAYALLNDEGGTFDGGALLKKCLAAVAQNPYGSLALDPSATEAMIKKAYRKLALKLHPDKNPKTTPLFQAVKTAYDCLQDSGGRGKAKRAYESAERNRSNQRREYATMRETERRSRPRYRPQPQPQARAQPQRPQPRARAYQQQNYYQQQAHHAYNKHAWGCGYGARPKPRYGPEAARARYEEVRRAEARRAELQRARERAQAVERARKLRERQREMQRQRERRQAEARARGGCRPKAGDARERQRERYEDMQRERDEAIRRGARLAAARERAKREEKERFEREREARLAEEARKREAQQKAQKHASMFDDLMAGMAAKRRAAQMRAAQLSPAPVGLRVTDVEDAAVALEWCSTEDHPAKGFDVQWKLYHQAQWANANVAFSRCKKKNLERGTRYCFRVRVAAAGAKPASPWSRSVDATTTEPVKAPSPRKRQSPILQRTANDFVRNMDARRKPFGDASNTSPRAPATGAPAKPFMARQPPSGRPGGWFELKDANGQPYYWNAKDDVSQWEPPSKWAEETDPTSGVAYYTDGAHSTWRRPADYVAVAKPSGKGEFARQTVRARAPVR